MKNQEWHSPEPAFHHLLNILGVKFMSQVGEIRRGWEIGKNPNNKFIWLACENCGYTRWVQTVKDKPTSKLCISCAAKERSTGRAREKNNNWKGGTYRSGGYIFIRKSNHPRTNKRGYVKRAILILEGKLGRYLWPNAEAHHINGIKDDDRPENLMELFHDEHFNISRKKRHAKTKVKNAC